MGFALLEVAVRIAIPVCIYRLARALELSFWPSVLATTAAAYSFTSLYSPRPGMFTILFVILELQLLFSALLKNQFSKLYWLPPIFLLWASIHIQFIHGLIILAIFAFEPLLNFVLRYPPAPPALPAKSMWIFLASILATLCTPYFWHIYSTVFLYAGQKNIYQSISEMLAMTFSGPGCGYGAWMEPQSTAALYSLARVFRCTRISLHQGLLVACSYVRGTDRREPSFTGSESRTTSRAHGQASRGACGLRRCCSGCGLAAL